MKDIVFIENNEIVVSHRDIAKFTNIQQKNIVEMITKYEYEIKEFGRLAFKTEGDYEIKLKQKENPNYRPNKIYYLNEHQATFLMTLLKNNEIVVNFKKNLIKQFIKMKSIIEDERISFLQDVFKKQEDDIIRLIDNKPLISHRMISLCTFTPERQILRLIKRTKNILEKYNLLKIKVETVMDYPKGKEPITYYFDERQTLILLSYLNPNPSYFEFKENIIDGFMAFRKFEENKKSNLYLENKVKELEVKIENMKNLLS